MPHIIQNDNSDHLSIRVSIIQTVYSGRLSMGAQNIANSSGKITNFGRFCVNCHTLSSETQQTTL